MKNAVNTQIETWPTRVACRNLGVADGYNQRIRQYKRTQASSSEWRLRKERWARANGENGEDPGGGCLCLRGD